MDKEPKGSKRVKAEELMSRLKEVGRPGGSVVVKRSAKMDLNLRCGTADVNEFPAAIQTFGPAPRLANTTPLSFWLCTRSVLIMRSSLRRWGRKRMILRGLHDKITEYPKTDS